MVIGWSVLDEERAVDKSFLVEDSGIANEI